MPPADSSEVKVLITGFGPFLDITTNPSFQIAQSLPTTLVSSSGSSISLIVPDTPIPAVYHKILAQAPALVARHCPDIVVHMGLAVEREYFAVEQSAARDGYHEVPDVERRVFTRAENKKEFGKSTEVLSCGLDLESVVDEWRERCSGMVLGGSGSGKGKRKGKGKGKEGKSVDVRLSDDVGNYVCGFIYYVSLKEMLGRKGKKDVVFLHVPLLKEQEVGVAVEVVGELVRALVDAWVERMELGEERE